MADLQTTLAEAVKLNWSIERFLRFSGYDKYSDLSGLELDLKDGEQIFLRDELSNIVGLLDDARDRIAYLSRPIVEVSRLRKGTTGKYQTTKGHFYDCRSGIEALVSDEYREVPYWTRTVVEHDGEDYYMVGYKGVPLDGLRVRVRSEP